MLVTYKLPKDRKLTPEQVREVDEAAKLPITFDEDCPESTPEMLEAFRKAALERNRRNYAREHLTAVQ